MTKIVDYKDINASINFANSLKKSCFAIIRNHLINTNDIDLL